MSKGQERGLPSGWYRDPVHLHAARFWDGERWTEQVVDVWEGDEQPPSSLDVWMGTRTPTNESPDEGVIIDLRSVDRGAGASGGDPTRGNGRSSVQLLTAAEPRTRRVDVISARRVTEPREASGASDRRSASPRWAETVRPQVARIARGARVAVAAVLVAVDVILYRKVR